MNVRFYVRAWLCLYLGLSVFHLEAQDLKIGDTLPPEVWNLPLQVLNHPDGKETVTLNDYKGKLIILDFWATWCSPCVAMMPRQDSLQKEFEGQLQILAVTYQTGEEVGAFMEKYTKRGKVSDLPKIVNNYNLRPHFLHNMLPHYVWIDEKGEVIAITDFKEVSRENIRSFIRQEKQVLALKSDPKQLDLDRKEPLFINGNGGDGKTLMYHSLFSKYTPGLSGSFFLTPVDSVRGIKLTGTNLSRISLFQKAFGERSWMVTFNRIILDVKDLYRWKNDLTGQLFREWMMDGNGFCYELILPPAHVGREFEIMRRDLAFFFPEVTATVEKQIRTCYVLTKVRQVDSLLSKGEDTEFQCHQFKYYSVNYPLGSLLKMLNGKFLSQSPYPVIDETGIEEGVSLDLEANLSNVDELNRALDRYGLKLIEKQAEIDMLVIRDR